MYLKNIATVVIALLICWTGSATSAQPPTLGIGDVVRVSVYGHPDLSSVERISQDGNIAFPLVGELSIAGLTERQAEMALARLLDRKQIVKSPQVSLTVEQYQSQRVSVLGTVAKPGVYEISRDSTLIDVIAEAGGLTDAAGDTAILTRSSGAPDDRTVIDLASVLNREGAAKDIPVFDGDKIYVPRTPRFYIYGQVNRPDVYRLERGMTIMQAISVAGGLTDKGTERGLTIKRANPSGDGTVSIGADVMQTIQEDDVIYVKESLF